MSINVLWISINRKGRVTNYFDDFRREFYNNANVISIIDGNKHKQPLTQIGNFRKIGLHELIERHSPDILICDSIFAYLQEDWSSVKVPVAIIIEDQHSNDKSVTSNWLDIAIKNDFIVIHRYKFNKYYTDLHNKCRVFWSPHSINTDIFKDYGLSKEYGVLQTGAIYKIYKTRNIVYDTLKTHKEYHRIVRPVEYTDKQWPIGVDYAKELNKAYLSVCCGAAVEYPVRKFFEIPACKSVIYGDYFNELGDLGFIPNVNMIQIDISDIPNQIDRLLKNKDKLTEIANNGYALIQDRHTNQIRSIELYNYLKSQI